MVCDRVEGLSVLQQIRSVLVNSSLKVSKPGLIRKIMLTGNCRSPLVRNGTYGGNFWHTIGPIAIPFWIGSSSLIWLNMNKIYKKIFGPSLFVFLLTRINLSFHILVAMKNKNFWYGYLVSRNAKVSVIKKQVRNMLDVYKANEQMMSW